MSAVGAAEVGVVRNPAELGRLASAPGPLTPEECMELAERAAGALDLSALDRDGRGDALLLWRSDGEPGAVTIHVYSAPIRTIGHYEVEDGELQRRPGRPDEPSTASPRLLAEVQAALSR